MITRILTEDGQFLVTKSDSGFMIKKTNPDNPERPEFYEEAWDKYPTLYEYEETDVEISAYDEITDEARVGEGIDKNEIKE